jgi:hypothetical protein
LIPTDRLGIACSPLREPASAAAVKPAARNGQQRGILESNRAAMKDQR